MISMPNNNLNTDVLIRIVQQSYRVFREAKKSNMTKNAIVNELAKRVEKEVRENVNQNNQVD